MYRLLAISVRVCLLLSVCLVGWPASGEAQTFDPNVYYQIQIRHSGRCLDVVGVSTANQAQIQQWGCATVAQANQLWTVLQVPGAAAGTFWIVSANSAKCLDIAGLSAANGALLQQYDCNITPYQTNQIFTMTASPDGGSYYRVKPVNSGKCLDVPNASTSNGVILQQWTCGPSGFINEDFLFIPYIARQPLTHLTTFGYYGTGMPLGPVADHVNSAGFTTQASQGYFMGQAYSTYGIKGRMEAIGELVVLKARDGLATPGTACQVDRDYTGDIYARGPNEGGLRLDYVNYWNTVIKPGFSPYDSALQFLYWDEPYSTLMHWGFCPSDVSTIIQTINTLLKQPGQYPNVPFAVVEAPHNTGLSYAGADWVGTYCYETDNTCTGSTGTQVSYRTLLDQLEAGLTAQQKVLVVPLASVPKPTGTVGVATTPTEQQDAASRADYYLGIALADSKVVGMVPWIGWTFDDGFMKYIGTEDIPGLRAKYRFVMRALGFGQ